MTSLCGVDSHHVLETLPKHAGSLRALQRSRRAQGPWPDLERTVRPFFSNALIWAFIISSAQAATVPLKTEPANVTASFQLIVDPPITLHSMLLSPCR